MILLYLSLFLLLALLRGFAAGRALLLQRKHARAARAARALAQQPVPREGSSGKPDPYRVAKQQYELGRLTERRDRVEAKYFAWQARSEKLGRAVTRLRGLKGRWAPYLCGVLDVVLLLSLAALLGLGDQFPIPRMIESVVSWRRG